jgi:hypothetical protein
MDINVILIFALFSISVIVFFFVVSNKEAQKEKMTSSSRRSSSLRLKPSLNLETLLFLVTMRSLPWSITLRPCRWGPRWHAGA